MSQCSNPKCRAKLSCGCQRKIASDGASVCTNCLAAYEKDLIMSKKAAITNNNNTNHPIVTSVTYNPPKT